MMMNRIVKWAVAGVLTIGFVPAVGLARPRASLPTAMTVTPTSLDVPVAVKHTAKSSRKTSSRHKTSSKRKVSAKHHKSAKSRRVHAKTRRSAHKHRVSHKAHKKSSRSSRSA